MIKLNNVSFQYTQGDAHGCLRDVNLTIGTGEVIVICGESGCGKTTLTRLINGLIPHYYEGRLEGEVMVEGINVKESSLYDLAGVVGSVFQNPRTQFFTVDTDSELAFGCENMGIDASEIEYRIDKTVSELKIESLLNRSLFALSGGEKQKIACASISAMEPPVFVLDEPSSNLDIAAIGELKKVLSKWKERGKTIVIAEHRLYYLMEIADRVVYMRDGIIESSMSIGDFRKKTEAVRREMGLRSLHAADFSRMPALPENTEPLFLRDFEVSYQKNKVLHIPELVIPRGAVVGVIGNNGAGKTTFANCLCGLDKKAKGTLYMGGNAYSVKKRLQLCYMVMQDVNHQLFTESVQDEILLSMEEPDEEKAIDKTKQIMSALHVEAFRESHPMALSGGQKQRVAIASALASRKEVIVFDEPTSGLDHRHMREVARSIQALSDMGKTQFIITHDPELVAACCNYFIFIEHGTVVRSGDWTLKNVQFAADFFKQI